MADINAIIAATEVELEAAKKRRLTAMEQRKLILEQARREGKTTLSEEEQTQLEDLKRTIESAKSQIDGIRRKLEEARQIKQEEELVLENARTPDPAKHNEPPKGKPHYDDVVRVTAEARTYNPDVDPRGQVFLQDICKQFLYQDVGAGTRLARHMQEERVERGVYMTRAGEVGTGAFTGLVVPQYLVDMVAPAVANLRPFADVCNKHPLPPDGMSVNISRITTASAAGLQTSENASTGIGATSMDDTLLTVNVQTAAGTQTVSRQAIDRGTGIEDVVLQDLFARYHTTLDSTLINQSTTGLTNVAQANTYTDTQPTAAKVYPKIIGAEAAEEAALLAMATPSHAVMHSRRWYWLAKEMVSTWPFINTPRIPVQAGGTATSAAYNGGVRGELPNGLLVVVDNNVPTNLGVGTNEDEIYVVPSRECHLWEQAGNAPAFIRAEQPAAATLGVLLVVYGYFAYTFGRYTNGMQKVSGTGLVSPTF